MSAAEEGDPKPAAPGAGRCPVCSEGLAGGELVHCNRCATPHHEACWRFNRRCGVFGCGSRAFGEIEEGGETRQLPRLSHPAMDSIPAGLAFALLVFPFVLLAWASWVERPLGQAVFAFLAACAWFGALGGARITCRLDRAGGWILRGVSVESIPLLPEWRWLALEAVDELEVLQLGPGRRYELWVRETSGERHRLGDLDPGDRDEAVAAAERIAEVLETGLRVALPPRGKNPPSLVAGFRRLLSGKTDRPGDDR